VGPAGGAIRVNFDKSVISETYGYQALWKNNTEATDSMLASPDTYIVPKPGKETQAANLWHKRGKLLIPARIRLNTCKVSAVLSVSPLLSSAWVPVNPKSQDNPESWEKATCVWLNCTLGILAQMLVASPKILSRIDMSLEGQRNIPVPDMTATQIDQLADVFDQYAEVKQDRFRYADSPARTALDAAIAEVLNIPKHEIDQARRELAKEPAITGKRYSSSP